MTTLLAPPVESAPAKSPWVGAFACQNPEHYLAATRRERLRLSDRRWGSPVGSIPQHDYCAPRSADDVLLIRGRPAFCPIGGAAEDHEWVERAEEYAPRTHTV